MTLTRGFSFSEVMAGVVVLKDDFLPRYTRLELRAVGQAFPNPGRTLVAQVTGTAFIDGVADATNATGTIEISLINARRIRYQIQFNDRDGIPIALDGWKSVSMRRPLKTMTELPVTISRGGKTNLGDGTLHFPVRSELAHFLSSWRFPASPSGEEALFAPRARDRSGRLEVWYTTATEPASGTGLWLHHEVVRPSSGAPAYAHGWFALFPPDSAPLLSRFGPGEITAASSRATEAPAGFHTSDVHATARVLQGKSGDDVWDLSVVPGNAPPLYTMSKPAWDWPLLPSAHLVAQSDARISGEVRIGGRSLTLRDAPGASARIHGHGNAHRWGWLHADLGSGTALEIIAAVSAVPVFRRLPPLVFLRLRTGDEVWPRSPWRSAVGLLGASRFRADLHLPCWTIVGGTSHKRILVRVEQPPEQTATLIYTNPDGSSATCYNTERARVRVRLEERSTVTSGWKLSRLWELDGTGHAEIGCP